MLLNGVNARPLAAASANHLSSVKDMLGTRVSPLQQVKHKSGRALSSRASPFIGQNPWTPEGALWYLRDVS